MYDHSSVLIVVILLAALILATEIGTRMGRRYFDNTNDTARSHVGSIQASILGVLALLLGFTFSLSLQRFDTRSAAVTIEANAIGTAMLRADLVPASIRTETKALLREYLGLRVRAGHISLDRQDDRDAVVSESGKVIDQLWRNALRAAADDPSMVTSGLYIQSLNEVIDAYGSRDAALNRHVPETVLFLMFGALIMTATLVGFSSGVGGHRASMAAYALLVLIIFLSFVIIDLDRPRRGLIEVSQAPLVDLQAQTAVATGDDE